MPGGSVPGGTQDRRGPLGVARHVGSRVDAGVNAPALPAAVPHLVDLFPRLLGAIVVAWRHGSSPSADLREPARAGSRGDLGEPGEQQRRACEAEADQRRRHRGLGEDERAPLAEAIGGQTGGSS